MPEIISKAEFARRIGVGRSAVGNMIRREQLSAPALVERGGRVLIDETVARRQLRRRLDTEQRLRNGRARLVDGDTADDPIVGQIKSARLRQIELANERAEAEANERAGRYVLADDAKLELGRVAGRLVATFEGSLAELADAVAVDTGADRRGALLALRRAWRAIRGRLAGVEAEAAVQEPEYAEAAP